MPSTARDPQISIAPSPPHVSVAGGSLTASVVLSVARQRLPSPAGAWIISPMSSSSPLPSHAFPPDATDDGFAGDPTAWVAMHQLIANTGGPNELPLAHPDVAPAFGDFDGVCPLFISAVDTEVLRDDAVALAKAARRAGVPVKLSLARRGIHGLPIFAGVLPEGTEETALAARWLAEKLHPGFGDYE